MAKTVRTFQDAQIEDKSTCTSSVYVALRSPFACSYHSMRHAISGTVIVPYGNGSRPCDLFAIRL
jgi:hypothetical protein